jgi:uncharacterized membrane protein YphA (DoxX/SURF4 family)
LEKLVIRGEKRMNIALWVVQVLLAAAFGMAGFMKATQPKEKLATNMAWVNDFSPNTVRAIGVLEMLAAIGLLAPLGLNILPWLTPLAAIGLILTMLGAAFTHLRRGETPMIAINAVLGLLAAFVAYGRFDLLPF